MTTVINAAPTDTAMEIDKRYLCLVTIILICLKMGHIRGNERERKRGGKKRKERNTAWKADFWSAVINVATSGNAAQYDVSL